MEETNQPVIVEPKHSVKLIKGAKGNHQWEIKVIGDNPDLIVPKVVELDAQLESIYGGRLCEKD